MFRRKKKGMLDIREMQRRGKIRIPKRRKEVNADSEGFVDVGNNLSNVENNSKNEGNSGRMLSFMDSSSDNFSTEKEGYSKKEVDQRLEAMDNKIYKLEQRIELLERKTSSSPSGISW